ncbi:carboxypeptidase-like regulatory domain-containing protein [Flavobacterium sp. ZS1P14]|uniref:carboxypeptidase-like regulatory domain-containing protein n=1 Tax=Flavobacterium sp. ZS1P14 TaxID=3401729 RepID=UPI003AAFC1EB
MTRALFYLSFILLSCQVAIAQNTVVHIIDSKSRESISYASIKTNEKLTSISNAEGYFSISENFKSDDALLTVSHLGYLERKITIGELKDQQYTVFLEPIAFELDPVYISNITPDPYKIIAEVKKNLQINYKSNAVPTKDLIFYRQTHSLKPSKYDAAITKSTGYSKKELQATNADLKAFVSSLRAHPPLEFKDLLGNYYTTTVKQNNKSISIPKLEVLKATMLKNGDQSLDIKQMAENIFLKHLDTTKYYRFKSGLIGSRDTISLRKSFNEKKNKIKKTKLSITKSSLTSIIDENSFIESDKLNFVNNPELYDYVYEGKMHYNEDEFVYVLKFSPRKSKAKYVGKLYVSMTDYAVLRCDYNLAEGETVSGFNMKFILGIKTSENISNGTIIYEKKTNDISYHLHYFSMETGQYLYINRPLKLIELTHSEKDVAAFDIKIEGNVINKTEFLNLHRSEITPIAFEKIKEEEFKYISLKRYDPQIWKDFITIEPLEEIKQFRAIN